MTGIPWIQYNERVVGRSHPTFVDVANRPLRTLLSESGYDPDAVPFPGFAGFASKTHGALGPVFNVKAFLADPTGAADATAAFQETDTAAKAAGGALYVPFGTYKLNGLVTVSGDNRAWIQDAGATILCANASGPCLKFAGVTVPMYGLRVNGLRLKRTTSAYRQPMVQFGDANALTRFRIQEVSIDGDSILGDGMLIHTLFNGVIRDVDFLAGGGGIGCVYRNDPAINSGNIVFENWSMNANPILFLIQEYYGLADNLINSLKFINCKAYNPNANKFFAGTSGGSASVGAMTIALTGGQGSNYAAGDWIVVVNATGKVWADRVASVATDTLTLTAPGGLPFALVSGDPVIVGRWHTVLGANVSAVDFDIPHFERTNGIVGTGSRAVKIETPYLGVDVPRTTLLVKSCQQWNVDRPRGTNPSGGVVMHQMNDANNSRNSVSNVSLTDLGGLGAMLQIDGGSAISWKDRFGGTSTLLGIWHQDTTVAAGQVTIELTGPVGVQRGVRMRSKGSLTALVVQVSSNRTAGTLTATVWKNGVATTLSGVIDGTNPTWIVTELGASIPYSPGDYIIVRVTTDAGWLPTVNNLDVSVYGEQ